MKCNLRELALLSDQPCIIEGRLNYKKVYHGTYRNQTVFKERWFRLVKNYLFYFKISEMGKFDTKNPAGVFILENSSVQMEHGESIPFSFSISFIDEPDKKHVFAARAEDNVVQWVKKLRESTYEYLRNSLHTLQSKIYAITGKDPLLMVPRNEGACLWAPAVPFSTTPACTVNTTSFSCHLHTNLAFTLERSKSDAQAFKYYQDQNSKKPTFYVDSCVGNCDNPEKINQSFHLERSKTAALLPDNLKPDISIFDTRPAYSRAAPSPPVRKKSSPNSGRAVTPSDVEVFRDLSKKQVTSGILDEMPIPPRRRIPKFLDNNDDLLSISNEEQTSDNSEDLIKF